jgi:hypothetical protein
MVWLGRHHPTEHSYNKPEEAALRTRIGPPPPIAFAANPRTPHRLGVRDVSGLSVRAAELSFNGRSAVPDV